MNKYECPISNRCPVVYKGTALMPMRWRRVNKYVKEGKGVIVRTKQVGVYLRLKVPPETKNVQEVTLGFDPGSQYNGFTISTSKVHNFNCQRDTVRKEQLKSRVLMRKDLRRKRRCRLRHRPTRLYKTRGYCPSTIYMVDSKLQMVMDLNKIYPISHIIYEDLRFNHYRNHCKTYFSDVEIGKTYIKQALQSIAEYSELVGWQTKTLRDIIEVPKDFDKHKESFWTHCIDSYVLSLYGLVNQKHKYTNTRLVRSSDEWLPDSFARRVLRIFSIRGWFKKDGVKYLAGDHHRRRKNGKLEVIIKRHPLKYVKFRTPGNIRSNHGPWTVQKMAISGKEYRKRTYTRSGGGHLIKSGANAYKGVEFFDRKMKIRIIR